MSVEPWMRGVAAHGHDAAAGPAHVAQQQLQDAGGADHLHAGRVLRPADRVDDRAGALAAGILAQHLRDPDDLLGRAAADLRHDFRRVAARSAACRI